jgi:hypothetical protein
LVCGDQCNIAYWEEIGGLHKGNSGYHFNEKITILSARKEGECSADHGENTVCVLLVMLWYFYIFVMKKSQQTKFMVYPHYLPLFQQ